MIKNILISSAVTATLSSVSFNVNALSTGDILTIDKMGSEVTGCVVGIINSSTGDCQVNGTDNPALNITSFTGSYFDYGPVRIGMSGLNGIIIGATQLASGSHSGPINGTESPNIDNPFVFISNTGMHLSTNPITVISETELDFTGWNMTWNGIERIILGGCSQIDETGNGGFSGCDYNLDGIDDIFNSGIATISITNNSYVLDYFANIPAGDPSGTGGAAYKLHLEGSIISAVPIPAAVWLFGSGLIGLAALFRRKRLN
jgi:hypothetical protein